jgi:hypothetical protein
LTGGGPAAQTVAGVEGIAMAEEFPVPADKLRKLVKKSRQMPIAFGFNAGTSDDDDEYLAAHARKPPELMGKIAKTEGAGNKAAYGTFVAEGSEIHLTCFQTISQLAKKFKKFLKINNKITLNVVVMDPDGNIIDSDVEVLEDWFRDEGDEDEDDDEDSGAATVPPPAPPRAAAVQAPAPAAAPLRAVAPPPPAPETAVAQRAARLRAVQAKLAGLPPDLAARLRPAVMEAAQLLREERPDDADAILRQLTAVLARVQVSAAARPRPPAPPPAAEAPAHVPAEAPARAATLPLSDPRLARLRTALGVLRGQAAGLPAGLALHATLDRAGQALDGGAAHAALAAMKDAQAAQRDARRARARWDRAQAILAAPVARALAGGGRADPDTLRRGWDAARQMADQGQWDRALAALPAIIAAVR